MGKSRRGQFQFFNYTKFVNHSTGFQFPVPSPCETRPQSYEYTVLRTGHGRKSCQDGQYRAKRNIGRQLIKMSQNLYILAALVEHTRQACNSNPWNMLCYGQLHSWTLQVTLAFRIQGCWFNICILNMIQTFTPLVSPVSELSFSALCREREREREFRDYTLPLLDPLCLHLQAFCTQPDSRITLWIGSI